MATITTTISIDNVDGEEKTITGVCTLESDAIYSSKQVLTNTFEMLGTAVPMAATMILKNMSATNSVAINIDYTSGQVVYSVPPGQISVIPYLWRASDGLVAVAQITARAATSSAEIEYCIIY
jgi:hypothetical protein